MKFKNALATLQFFGEEGRNLSGWKMVGCHLWWLNGAKQIDEENSHPAKAGCISACHPRSSLHCTMRIGYQPCAFSEQHKCCRSRPRPTHRRMAHKSCWQKAGSQNCKRRIHNLVLATPLGHKSCTVRQGLSDRGRAHKLVTHSAGDLAHSPYIDCLP